MRCTVPSTLWRAKSVPNIEYRPSIGAPTTIGIAPPPSTRLAMSITRPKEPIVGEESNVEQTL